MVSDEALRPSVRDAVTALAFLALSLFIVGCGTDRGAVRIDADTPAFYRVKQPSQRHTNPQNYFGPEYEHIWTRRGEPVQRVRPPELVGLALSGGGIRSAAFQLGLLSALNRIPYHHTTWLKRTDYVSSVSGGSWANGLLTTHVEGADHLFSCLDDYAENELIASAECAFVENALRREQKVAILPVSRDQALDQRKEQWQRAIATAYLPPAGVDFSTSLDAGLANHMRTMPYPIFNSTHSAPSGLRSESGNSRNKPFETTPDYVGTIADDRSGFFLSTKSKEFSWRRRRHQRYFALKRENREDLPGTDLSLTLAHSSAVLGTSKPFLLQYNLGLTYLGKPVAGLRPYYKLTDGGKSDNLGLLPLLERGVNVVISSQMGREKKPYADLRLALAQAEKLFHCRFDVPVGEPPSLVTIEAYDCSHHGITTARGTLVLIHPTTDHMLEFMNFLKQQHPVLFKELSAIEAKEKKGNRFPRTPTFRMTYEKAQVRAYYVLGKYIGEHSLASELAKLRP